MGAIRSCVRRRLDCVKLQVDCQLSVDNQLLPMRGKRFEREVSRMRDRKLIVISAIKWPPCKRQRVREHRLVGIPRRSSGTRSAVPDFRSFFLCRLLCHNLTS
jgi:hypothetical protein